MIKKFAFLLTSAVLLVGCSNCGSTQPEPNQPTPTVAIPDAGPVPTASASSTSETPAATIDWKTPEELFELGKKHPDLCAMVLFPDILTDDKSIEVTLADPKIVEFVDKTFVSMRFPLTKKNLEVVAGEFQLEGLPTLIFTPPSSELVLIIKGVAPADKLLKALEQVTAKDAPFEKCAKIKAKIN